MRIVRIYFHLCISCVFHAYFMRISCVKFPRLRILRILRIMRKKRIMRIMRIELPV